MKVLPLKDKSSTSLFDSLKTISKDSEFKHIRTIFSDEETTFKSKAFKKKVKDELNINLVTSKSNKQPRAESLIRWFKQKMSLYLYEKNERSYKNWYKYAPHICKELNANVINQDDTIEDHKTYSLFIIPKAKTTFKINDRVYLLHSKIKKTNINFKSSIDLGKTLIF